MSISNKFHPIFKFLNRKKLVPDSIPHQASKIISLLSGPYLKGNISSASSQSTQKKQLSLSDNHSFFARLKQVFVLEKKECMPSGLPGSYRLLTADKIKRGVSVKEPSSGLIINQGFLSRKERSTKKNNFLVKTACISKIEDQDWEEVDALSSGCSSTQLSESIRRLQAQIEEKLNENINIISEIYDLFHSKDINNDDLKQILDQMSLNFEKFFPPILFSKSSSYIDDQKNIKNAFNTYQSFILDITDLAKQKLEKKSECSLTEQKKIPVTDLDIQDNNNCILSESSKKEIAVLSSDSSQSEKNNDAQRLLSALNKTKENVMDIEYYFDDFNSRFDYLINKNKQQDLDYSKENSKAFTPELGLRR